VSEQQFDFGFDSGSTLPQRAAPAKKPKSPKAPVLSVQAAASTPAAVSELSVEAMAQALQAHPDFRVQRRLVPQLLFTGPEPARKLRVVILDTETTGLDADQDRIIELALLAVDVDADTGLPHGPVEVYDELQDPGMAIPAIAREITGITDDMVRGKRLDEARIADVMAGADLVIAHNAGFDRPFVESRLPAFRSLAWACSIDDVDWKAEGRSSAKLEYLALDNGWFYDAHRAEMDCHALLAILASPLKPGAQSAMKKLLSRVNEPRFKVQATGAPFESKDLLKNRGYRWDANRKVWHTQLPNEAALDAECDWLHSRVYGGRSARIAVERLDARVRYSRRGGSAEWR